MIKVQLIDGLDYPEDKPEKSPEAFKITSEILVRIQELDELMPNDGMASGGIRLINRLSKINRISPRAYRLLIDMVGERQCFTLSLEDLGKRHLNNDGNPTTRQSWLQNAQFDIQIIKGAWLEVGEVMEEMLKRRPSDSPEGIAKDD